MIVDGAKTPTTVNFVKKKWRNLDMSSILAFKSPYFAFDIGSTTPIGKVDLLACLLLIFISVIRLTVLNRPFKSIH